MTNTELELKVKEILQNDNMYDLIEMQLHLKKNINKVIFTETLNFLLWK